MKQPDAAKFVSLDGEDPDVQVVRRAAQLVATNRQRRGHHAGAGRAEQSGSATPRAFVVDDEDGICQLIMMTLATMGVEAKKFHNAADAVAALDHELPAIIFLDVALQKSDAIDVIRGLGERGYGGVVQLMSGSNVDLLEDVRRVGARHGLNMRPPLSKPFRADRSVTSSPARISPRARSPSSGSTRRSPRDGSSCGINRRSTWAATRSSAPRG